MQPEAEALNQLTRVNAAAASGVRGLASIVAFRNVMADGYAAVDHDLVGEAAIGRIPPLLKVVRGPLQEAVE